MRLIHRSDAAWLTLIFGVLAYELSAPPGELLSHAVDRYLRSHRVLVSAAVIVTAAHLLNLLESEPLRYIDPFDVIARTAGHLHLKKAYG